MLVLSLQIAEMFNEAGVICHFIGIIGIQFKNLIFDIKRLLLWYLEKDMSILSHQIIEFLNKFCVQLVVSDL